MAVMVGQVLVWASVMVVAAALEDSVKQDVESIFKSVDEFMAGKTNKILPVYGGGRHSVKEVNRSPHVEIADRGSRAGIPDRGSRAEIPNRGSRAGIAGPSKDRALQARGSFPVGVILSDNLYPLVVGKNVDTGMPFVMDLSQQHALVVARGGGSENYRMLIPFPVVVGAPTSAESSHEDTSDEEQEDFRNAPGVFNSKHPHYRPYQTRFHKKYPIGLHHDPYEKYYTNSPTQIQDSALSPPKVPKKYAQSYHYVRQHDSARPGIESSRYRSYSSKGPNERPVNTNFKEVQSQNVIPYNEGATPSPIEHSSSRDILGSAIKYSDARPQITYYVDGPRYPIPLPRPRYVYSRNYQQTYRAPSSEHYSDYKNDQYILKPTSPVNDRPQENSVKSYHSRKTPVTYEGVPKDFRPSPYLGNITEDNDVTGLQPQSEIIQSYDDDGAGDGEFTEQDYMDSIRDSPESHSSTGEVRHVTYHADDYLGKIYEDMYYKLPQDVESRSKEHMATEHRVTRNKQEQEPQEESKYEAEATTTYRQNTADTANPKTGPVTFDVPEQQVERTDR